MDSVSAIAIVNRLNQRLSLSMPPNSCHTHVDLRSLTHAILGDLGFALTTPSSPAMNLQQLQPQMEPIAIIGQSLRLPGGINNSENLWDALIEKRQDILAPTPQDRWDQS